MTVSFSNDLNTTIEIYRRVFFLHQLKSVSQSVVAAFLMLLVLFYVLNCRLAKDISTISLGIFGLRQRQNARWALI